MAATLKGSTFRIALYQAQELNNIVTFSPSECRITALGMESGEIQDSQLSASSSFDMISVGPQNARCELIMIDDNLIASEYFDSNLTAERLQSLFDEKA
ncbi:unnamed protein product [Onchocerca ochengi]|uniref:F5/8 type C domain-containing protein n=1 Tax=Onchocerca ochengi TaxID=42157 RepID=A0A182ET93_ONCOC|nr:unnamed protein product [Onchocerca ochengi]